MTNTTSEADMGYVKDFVSKIAEALVAATELPKQISDIKITMHALESDLERTKARNIELDTMLADTRRQRDEAEQALSGVRSELTSTRRELGQVKADYEDQNQRINTLRSELDQAKRDRDDAGFKHLEADERATQAEAKLKKLREALGIEESKPVEVNQPSTLPPMVESTFGNVPQAMPEPEAPPTQSPPPVQQAGEGQEAKRVYEGDVGYDRWHEGVQWDYEQRKYYHH